VSGRRRGDAVTPPLTVIAGPTASGKTALALELARQVGGEIVSADSQQVYRHFDVGTAKPSAAQLAAVPHHLVSCVEPLEAFSAARFQTLADEAIAGIQARGRRVVVVGGTGLYVRVLLHGVVPTPGRDEALRAELVARAEAEGNEALHAELARVDPPSAARLPAADRVRVIRALEITRLTGRPASAWREAHAFATQRHPATLWVLDPPRAELYEAIEARTRALFDGGLVEEVEALVARGYRDAAPMRAVGYVQALACLEGRLSRESAIAQAAQATRQYAKRQWTWFRKEPGARLLPPPFEVAQLL
jgi:tRNA dimethylallyltransferase